MSSQTFQLDVEDENMVTDSFSQKDNNSIQIRDMVLGVPNKNI